MEFGYFDNSRREYVINNPETPAPWVNYLGSPAYGAIISNNAGGYSFAKSGANGRILRYVFNNFDQPGRYIYIRDNAGKDYWSASWQPVGKNLEEYKSECRHGTAYTKITADYSGIHSEALYYVPLDKEYEVWKLCIANNSDRNRELTVTGYAEFTNNSNYEQDQVNLQYSQFITRTSFCKNHICQQVHGNLDALEEGKEVDGKTVTGCGALSTVITLGPGEAKTIVFVLGMKDSKEAEAILKHYNSPDEMCKKDMDTLVSYWHGKLSHFQVKTPSEEFDTMINTWNAYNCFMTFIWSRAASFIYCGLRNGYGYRDTVQDIQGIIHLTPEMALEKIRFMLSAQADNGGGLPLVKFTHNPGHEDTPDDPSYVKETGHPAYRADDALWLFPTVYKYISESGNLLFIDEIIPFANKDEGTVYEHLKRAIGFSMEHLGKHGMPAGLYADWNDCLRLGKDGESSFVSFQLYLAMSIMKKIAEYKKDQDYISYLDKNQEKLGDIIQKICWDEDRFIRGITEDGEIIGKRTDKEADIWLNPQSWAVISGLATDSQADIILDIVYKRLNTEYGAVLMDPPYHKHAFEGALAVIYNAGTKENAGIFSQSQGWIILAEALRGHGGRAFTYFMENAPSAQNDKAETRKLEPYCYGQFTEGKDSPHFGRSHVHWLTGTASTVMTGCVEGILGMRPDFYGLKIEPAIPAGWESFEINKDFRGKHLHIVANNKGHAETGCKKLLVNGKELESNYIPEELLTEQTEIIIDIS
ncbi:MAG: N,N'-diacetylchitobiose phosphorylase [Lachnospiraceae bacterium]|nr:N,N'-diacetylchitobiose phosphorylase [Lachnospiraceae bacterium]